jgi:hypothetical protein
MASTVSISINLTFSQLVNAIEQLPKIEQYQLLLYLMRKQEEDNLTVTHFASEDVLAKDWNTTIEYEAWQGL